MFTVSAPSATERGDASPGLIFDIARGCTGPECHVEQIDMIILVKARNDSAEADIPPQGRDFRFGRVNSTSKLNSLAS